MNVHELRKYFVKGWRVGVATEYCVRRTFVIVGLIFGEEAPEKCITSFPLHVSFSSVFLAPSSVDFLNPPVILYCSFCLNFSFPWPCLPHRDNFTPPASSFSTLFPLVRFSIVPHSLPVSLSLYSSCFFASPSFCLSQFLSLSPWAIDSNT